MSDIKNYIAEKAKSDPAIYERIAKETAYLDAAIAVHTFRQKQGLSQRDFAKIVGKPQSTIARIENGNMNPSIKTLNDIASKFDKQIKITFV
ncbi:helix-turn-helix domain-containing protein [Pectinatus haikarae]|uniref:DNA-binding XRE family transcriptional regulator n=1 Tax=Pectinatus haikarae TaxID=349096 RepID=A0ABT9Y5M0_9FIRM|nr:helix-turn-helix transcriptional regulator [Pectinatus haikarae]MDQ0202861.1 DNA-binding XRE family transcriptional regulator [Pectinatus haikarae]